MKRCNVAWMRGILLAATLYNVLWGAFVVLFSFAFSGLWGWSCRITPGSRNTSA